MHIGQKIRQLCEIKKIRKVDLASYLNMKRQNVYYIFEQESIQISLLKKISEFIKVPIQIFFEDENQENIEVAEQSIEYKSNYIEQLKITISALQSENDTLKRLLDMKDEQIENLKQRLDNEK
jgi:transcriptional regulator with XRE-family HTH domain